MRDDLGRITRRGHHEVAAATVGAGASTRFEGWSATGTPPGPDTVFEIGSITKALTGVLLADMHLRGEVLLSDPLSRHLDRPAPGWRHREPTLLELATHRSGLPNTPGPLARRELLYSLGFESRDPWADIDGPRYAELLRRTSPKHPPGHRMRYSSIGFGLLGDALAAAGGRPYGDLLRERVLEPLGMNATTLDPRALTGKGHSRRGAPRPPIEDLMPAAGSLRSSVADMARFLAACLSPGSEPPGPALALAQEPVHRIAKRMSIGLGWLIVTPRGKPRTVFHNGGTWGYRSFGGFRPERGAAVVVLANTAISVDRLGWRLLDAGR
jgi:CubicO group peptidase (beta-lactamase class C family)